MKPIKGYEGRYSIDENGNIYSHKYKKILVCGVSVMGYRAVQLTDENGKMKGYQLHRLIAESFIKNPLNKPFVNHINGIKIDNRIENLEWVTGSENVSHSRNILNRKSRGSSKIVLNKNTGIFYESAGEAGEALGLSKSYGRYCCQHSLNGLSYC